MWKNDGMEIIASDQGNGTTHSYVVLTDTEPLLIGDAAENQVHHKAIGSIRPPVASIEGRLGWSERNIGPCGCVSARLDGHGCVQLGIIDH